MKLLIADDQNSVHMFLDRMIHFAEIGIDEVAHARNGQEVLEYVKENWPELILLDIRMPVMDGIATLEQMASLCWDHKVLILSAYNEFEYARKCMSFGVQDYLLKPIDAKEVSSSLKRCILELEEIKTEKSNRLLQNFMDGSDLDVVLIPREMEAVGYGIVCCETGNVPNLSVEKNRFMRAGEFFHAATAEISIWVYRMKSCDEWEVFKKRHLETDFGFTVGFSRYHAGKSQVYLAISESIEAFRQGFYQTGGYSYEEERFKVYQGESARNLSDELRKSYERGDVQNLKYTVEKLFMIFQRENVHPSYVQDFCYGLLIQMNSDFVETLKKLRGNFLESEFHFMDSEGLKSTFLRLMIEMRLDIDPQEVQSDEDVVKRIRHYVDTNYDKDLSLDTLAKHFFISKYQISRLFKRQFEVNFSDYVLKIRMNAAGLMLKNTRYKVDEIARRSGFEETSYFSRVFGKYYGISPGEYRKRE